MDRRGSFSKKVARHAGSLQSRPTRLRLKRTRRSLRLKRLSRKSAGKCEEKMQQDGVNRYQTTRDHTNISQQELLVSSQRVQRAQLGSDRAPSAAERYELARRNRSWRCIPPRESRDSVLQGPASYRTARWTNARADCGPPCRNIYQGRSLRRRMCFPQSSRAPCRYNRTGPCILSRANIFVELRRSQLSEGLCRRALTCTGLPRRGRSLR